MRTVQSINRMTIKNRLRPHLGVDGDSEFLRQPLELGSLVDHRCDLLQQNTQHSTTGKLVSLRCSHRGALYNTMLVVNHQHFVIPKCW